MIREFNVGFDKALKPSTELVAKARDIVEGIPLKVEPRQKRKVLIYGISWGPHRNGMLTAVETLKMIGDETGAYESVIRSTLPTSSPKRSSSSMQLSFRIPPAMSLSAPWPKMRSRNCPWMSRRSNWPMPIALPTILWSMWKTGAAFSALTEATDCNKKIPEYIEMVGGAFYGHPWGPKNTVTVTVDEPEHGLIKGSL